MPHDEVAVAVEPDSDGTDEVWACAARTALQATFSQQETSVRSTVVGIDTRECADVPSMRQSRSARRSDRLRDQPGEHGLDPFFAGTSIINTVYRDNTITGFAKYGSGAMPKSTRSSCTEIPSDQMTSVTHPDLWHHGLSWTADIREHRQRTAERRGDRPGNRERH
jgi:hypothetical protein